MADQVRLPRSKTARAETVPTQPAVLGAPGDLTEQRLLLALELGGVGSFDWDLLTGQGAASKGCYDVFGYDLSTTPTYSNVLRVVLPDDLEGFCKNIDASLAEKKPFRCEFRIVRHSDHSVRWLRIDGGIAPDDKDRAATMVGIVRDVTERRSAQEREQLLMREVDHRAKNLLTVVQSLVQLTRAEDMDAFRSAVSGRIQALGRAHSLLAASRWEGADLSALVDEEIAPFAGLLQRIHIEGPPVKLRPAAAQSVALVLHELITNAAKYGALSNKNGGVDLHWSLGSSEEAPLKVRWCEHGGPAVQAPSRRGFGTTVISASVERQLGGSVRYDWLPQGLCCEFLLPSKELAASERMVAVGRPSARGFPEAPQGKAIRVLVVEDEPLIALQIAQLLKQEGCEIVGPAASVGEALNLVTASGFDAALLDIDLNGARSFPIADLLQEQGTPYAFLSGFGASELPARFELSPLLTKPICPNELHTFVARASDGALEEAELSQGVAQGQLL